MLEAYRGTYSAPIFHPMQSQNDFTNRPEFAEATLQELIVLDRSSDNKVSNNALLPPDKIKGKWGCLLSSYSWSQWHSP